MSEHTPSPWKWHWRQEDGIATGSIFSEIHPGHAYAVAMTPRYQTQAQWEADARLIAAAPELLVALKHCVIERSEWLEEARAAIAKAEGESTPAG